jgi:hypothetical protein
MFLSFWDPKGFETLVVLNVFGFCGAGGSETFVVRTAFGFLGCRMLKYWCSLKFFWILEPRGY